MSSKKYRKQLKRIHLAYNAKKDIKRTQLDFVQAVESLAKEAESSAKFLTNFTSNIANMKILKINEIEDFIICESCTKQCANIDGMMMDSDSNWFCPECWEELGPVMQKDYEELKAKGEN